MKIMKVAFTLVFLAAAVATVVVLIQRPVSPPSVESQQSDAKSVIAPSDSFPPPETVSEIAALPKPNTVPASSLAIAEPPAEKPAVATNKLDRLTQIRETFRALASGDKTNALRAAKQIVDETERETALLTLVTEWTQGELSLPRLRAQRIANFGLEAGLGIELGKYPDLALLWANELTEGSGRASVIQQAARLMVSSDPTAAFAFTQLVSEADRRTFSDALFAYWADKDTAAAMKWAEQLSNDAEREAAIQAIRSIAPVGIGTALGMQDGYPIINQLVPGTPAERSGQLHVGDRIVALAQGDNVFVDLHELPLSDIVQTIRGAPNTLVQLQILPAGAAPNSTPRTVSIMRDQIKFKK
jgi:hypothetical protein